MWAKGSLRVREKKERHRKEWGRAGAGVRGVWRCARPIVPFQKFLASLPLLADGQEGR